MLIPYIDCCYQGVIFSVNLLLFMRPSARKLVKQTRNGHNRFFSPLLCRNLLVTFQSHIVSQSEVGEKLWDK